MSEMFGWMSSLDPNGISEEIDSDTLLPAGDFECSSRLL
jgi:hypothetical protein